MQKKITCFCWNSFEVNVPEEIDLDSESIYMEEIQNGSFFNFICPSCGKKHKPEFPVSLFWPSRHLFLIVIPEQDRFDFYRKKKQPARKGHFVLETLIGYPELSDRLAVLRNDLNPVVVEALKYHLQMKADEQYPDSEMEIWYYCAGNSAAKGVSPDFLEFHIHGIKADEVAVMRIPFSVYEKTLGDYKKHPKAEIFKALRFLNYLSYKNTMH